MDASNFYDENFEQKKAIIPKYDGKMKTWQQPTLPHSCVQYHRR